MPKTDRIDFVICNMEMCSSSGVYRFLYIRYICIFDPNRADIFNRYEKRACIKAISGIFHPSFTDSFACSWFANGDKSLYYEECSLYVVVDVGHKSYTFLVN